MKKYVIPLDPRTKKNSQQIIRVKRGDKYVSMITPSAQYKKYESAACYYLRSSEPPIKHPVNVECHFYMETRRRVDLNNLLECATDVLVTAGVLADDNSSIVIGHDGSRVHYDKDNPRTEITITEV